jgi:hypothetical protein
MFGASHSGNSSTNAFHCPHLLACATDDDGRACAMGGGGEGSSGSGSAYVGSEDVMGDGGLVDGRVLVCFQVYQRVVRDALGNSLFCSEAVGHFG